MVDFLAAKLKRELNANPVIPRPSRAATRIEFPILYSYCEIFA